MKYRMKNGDTLNRDETLKDYICAVLDETPDKIDDILQSVSKDQEKAFIEMLRQDLESRVSKFLKK